MMEFIAVATSTTVLYLMIIDRIIKLEKLEQERQQVDTDLELMLAKELMKRKQLEECRPKACKNCIDYYGISYGGNVLICGIHPSGVDTDKCPDWR